jgi:hypothetical protein
MNNEVDRLSRDFIERQYLLTIYLIHWISGCFLGVWEFGEKQQVT